MGGARAPPAPPLATLLVTCQHQATTSDLLFYDIFAPPKNSSFEVSDDDIACDLWFTPPIKNPGYAYDSGSRFSTCFFFN